MLRTLTVLGVTLAFIAASCSGAGGEAGTSTGLRQDAAPDPATSENVLPPSSFTAEAGSLAVVLTWARPPGPVEGYAIFRDGVELGTLLASATRFTDDRGVVPNREYLYEIEARAGTAASERVAVSAETVEPPLKAARLQGTFNVRARNVSVTGFREHDVPTYGWFFHPLCDQRACDARFGDLHQKRVRTKLERRGARYRGSYTGHFGVECESTPASSTVTIALEVVAARAVAGEWRGTRVEGTITIAQAAQLGCTSGRVEQEIHARLLR